MVDSAAGRSESTDDDLHILIAGYSAPQRLRAHHKFRIKQIKSLQQGYDGTSARCYFCKQLGINDTDLQLHHLNHKLFDNRLENLEPAHQTCNNREHARWRALVGQRPSDPSCVSVSEIRCPSHTYQKRSIDTSLDKQKWTSEEGRRHDIMRNKWNNWLLDNVDGPYKNGRWRLTFRELAYMAVGKLGLGSSVTYKRYIMEDSYAGILRVYIDETTGHKMVEFIVKPQTEPAE